MVEASGILKDLYAVLDRVRCDDLDCEKCSLGGAGSCYHKSREAGERLRAWLESLPDGAISKATIDDLL